MPGEIKKRRSSDTGVASNLAAARPEKKVYIELLRVVACFLVIVNHTLKPVWAERGPSFTWFAGIAYFFLCKIAVPLFLMIMGAVLLHKTDSPEKAAKRLLRGLGVFVAVSAVYYVYYAAVNAYPVSLLDFLGKALKTQTTNALWYMYLYIGLLCLLPLLQKLVGALDRKDIRWLLFLSVGVLGALPLVRLFVPAFGLSPYFTAVLLSPYIGMVVWGYYLERYVTVDRGKAILAGGLFVGLIALQVLLTYWFYQQDPEKYLHLDDRTMITITGATACFYIVVKYLFSQCRIGERLAKVINYLGGLTFGIYLLSDLVISLTRPLYRILCGRVHVLIAMGLWQLTVFGVCAVIAAGLKLLPGIKKWL